MPCTRETPCGGVLRVVLVAADFLVEECLNGHSYRSGAPPRVIVRPGQYRDVPTTGDGCTMCDGVIEPARVRLKAMTCAACAERRREAAKNKDCQWCVRSKRGPCSRHGGVSPEQRDRDNALRNYYERKAAHA